MLHKAVITLLVVIGHAASANYFFHVANDCHTPASVVVRYQDMDNAWRTSGWYDFAPGEGAFLAPDDRRLVSRNANFYFYAKAMGSGYSWKGSDQNRRDRTYYVNGQHLRFRHVHDQWWDNNVRLDCSNLAPPQRLSAYLFALVQVAEKRYSAGRTATANALVSQLAATAYMEDDAVFRSGLVDGGSGPTVPCPGGLDESECQFVRDVVANERIKKAVANWSGLGAGFACGAGAAATGVGLLVSIPAAVACNIFVNSATRTAFNCGISEMQRSIIGGITGRDTSCFEIGFGLELVL